MRIASDKGGSYVYLFVNIADDLITTLLLSIEVVVRDVRLGIYTNKVSKQTSRRYN